MKHCIILLILLSFVVAGCGTTDEDGKAPGQNKPEQEAVENPFTGPSHFVEFEAEGQIELSDSAQARLRAFWEANVPAFDRAVTPGLRDRVKLSSPAYSDAPGSAVDSLTAIRLRKVGSFFIRYHPDLEEDDFAALPETKPGVVDADFGDAADRRILVRVGIFGE
jgi:hypothetical protein